MRAASRFCRQAARPVVFVPTMGALHRGHAALVRRARREAGDAGTVVVSIYVNPSQFGAGEDLARYPRTFRRDRELCARAGADAVFAPVTLYPEDGGSTWVVEERLSLPLCGKSRPGHFRGVCTVVAKLFHVVAPDVAVFGEKDWQQLAVIRRMVRDLDFPMRVVGCPTVREPDGLACSSRNAYLSPADRAAAAGIFAVLDAAARTASGPADAVARASRGLRRIPGCRIDYVEARDAATLGAPMPGRPARLLAAVFLGGTRLIDNVPLRGG